MQAVLADALGCRFSLGDHAIGAGLPLGGQPRTASKLLAWYLTFGFMRSVTPPGNIR
jgi:hypothetical protein